MSGLDQGRQLTLGVRLRDDATFANYHGSHNQDVVERLQQLLLAGQSPILLCGDVGAGKSHLLQASCAWWESRGQEAMCLDMLELAAADPAVLQGLETADLLCLDGLDAVLGSEAWETAIFHLHNRMVDAGHLLLMSASAPPASLPVQLPDLASRLGASLVLQLARPRDDDRLAILQARAERRGLVLNDETARFILRRAPRGTGELLAILDRLDELSMRAQRRLTIPFVKATMDW
ncbi:DnaA regulatory inactivator Hda [Marinobacteraceae bacterium S3BR75-40.1]